MAMAPAQSFSSRTLCKGQGFMHRRKYCYFYFVGFLAIISSELLLGRSLLNSSHVNYEEENAAGRNKSNIMNGEGERQLGAREILKTKQTHLSVKHPDPVDTKEKPVHLLYATDNNDGVVLGLEASIRSVYKHASESVVIHYFGQAPLPSFPDIEFLSLEDVHERYNLTRFTNLNPHMWPGFSRLNSLANYVRFVMADLFPDISKIMWIDADTIVRCDVVNMVRSALSKSEYVIAAVDARRKPMTVDETFLTNISTSFNAGVLVVDLDRWKSQNITSQVEMWARRNKQENIYQYGSQPPLQLTIGDNFEHLDPNWIFLRLGHDKNLKVPDDACLLWNGKRKHWLDDGLHKNLVEYQP